MAFSKQNDVLYVKTQPKHFPLNNVPGEAYIEQWIKLEGNVAKIHAKVTMFRSGKTQFEARYQEMPYVYINGSFHNIWTYQGNSLYTS